MMCIVLSISREDDRELVTTQLPLFKATSGWGSSVPRHVLF